MIHRSTHGNATHGLRQTKIYDVWQKMRSRCIDPRSKDYPLYGGRGITICDQWMRFEGFASWDGFGGYKPGLQIDRIDNNRGYSPENCRWVTCSQNNRNRRSTKLCPDSVRCVRMLCWSGLTRQQAARIMGISKTHANSIMNFQKWGDV